MASRLLLALASALLFLSTTTPASAAAATTFSTINVGIEFSEVSTDGRYVAIQTLENFVVPEDTNGTYDVFVYDVVTGAIDPVSTGPSGALAPSGSGGVKLLSISDSGRYVCLGSTVNGFFAGDDTDPDWDVFVHDRQTGTTELVSGKQPGQAVHGASTTQCDLSNDGRYVYFDARVAMFGSEPTHLFLRDRVLGTTAVVTPNAIRGLEPDTDAEGRRVVYRAIAAAGQFTGQRIFVFDRQTGTTQWVSSTASGGVPTGSPFSPSISGDGRFIAFAASGNLGAPDESAFNDVYVRDVDTGELTVVAPVGGITNGDMDQPVFGPSGRHLVVTSSTNNLVPGDTNARRDVFLYDRTTRIFRQMSILPDGTSPRGGSYTQVGDPFSVARNVVIGDGRGAMFKAARSQFEVPRAYVRVDAPIASIGNAMAAEDAGTANMPVALDGVTFAPGRLDYEITAGSAGSSDAVLGAGSVDVPAGATSVTIPVQIQDDALYEEDETVTVCLTDAVGLTVGNAYGALTIEDNDPKPIIDVSDASTEEGGVATFGLSLSEPAGVDVVVLFASEDGSAHAPDDYTAVMGAQETIPAGSTTGTLSVNAAEDGADEPDETFSVRLTGAVNGTVGDGAATGTILDDDLPPCTLVQQVLRLVIPQDCQ